MLILAPTLLFKILVVIYISYLDKGVMKTPERRFLSFSFACLCPKQIIIDANLFIHLFIYLFIFVTRLPATIKNIKDKKLKKFSLMNDNIHIKGGQKNCSETR